MSKYPAYNEDDTFWDDHHRQSGQMTNREFFSSNAEGGFYEGMEWNGDEWVLDEENQRKQDEEDKENSRCYWCKEYPHDCEC